MPGHRRPRHSGRPVDACISGIARQARFLHELIADGREDGPADPATARSLLEQWRTACAEGEHQAFTRRLAWDGLDEESACTALARGLVGGPDALPSWAEELAAALAAIVDQEPVFTLTHPTAFGELWIGFADRASARRQSPELSEGAAADLRDELLTELARTGELAVYSAFDAFRGGQAGDRGSRNLYEAFLCDLFGGGILSLVKEYAALARQVGQLLESWLAATAELLRRLRSDRDDLASHFARGHPLGRVAGIKHLSERHAGGRRTLCLTFESGLQLIYKPREVGLESIYHRFLDWLREKGLQWAPPSLRVLAREDYGWVEYVHQAQAADAAVYYRKAGALLAVAHALGAVDLHMDNLIAGAQGPIVCDAEAFLQPRLHGLEPSSCVLDPGLLWFLQVDPRGRPYDISGMCGTGGHLATETRRAWRFLNSDAMVPVQRVARGRPGRNLLWSKGRLQSACAHAAELVQGFEAAYRFLYSHREEILRPGGPLSWFAGHSTRIVFRPSQLYADLLLDLCSPDRQRHGWQQTAAIETLHRGLRDERPGFWPLAAEERRALERLDIPVFRTPVDVPEPRIAGLVSCSGLQAAAERLLALDESDRHRQSRAILSALGSPGRPFDEMDPMLRAARQAASEILAQAVRGEDGSPGWPCTVGEGSLYDGASGILLFLAALSRLTGDPVWAQGARAAMKTVASSLATPLSVGACSGLGGIVYALTCAGRFLAEERCIELARRAASAITPARIAAERRLDVEGGAAGAILGLLALYTHSPEDVWLQRAVDCAEHLLATALPAGAGGRAWPDPRGSMLAGFAHGAAGIGFSLVRLHRVTGHRRFLEAALAGVFHERSLYCEGRRNWAVADGTFLTAWCHGAPGIALSRLALLGALEDDAVREDLKRALETTLDIGVLDSDSVCCGNMSLVEVLWVAGWELGLPALRRAAGARAVKVCDRALRRGAFCLTGAGFFQGLAGAGYQCLRLAFPKEIPSVLTFEPVPT
ncbi:MAG: type 2 lantipeptide synthetase LanM family protein [Armatimonadetes bacterium]|nr:type 2 lantipeptide synthetase LanM family protein [Armatimonadota bacterium]